MFRTLRGRLVLSHIVPLLIVMPLLGIALVYLLETKVVVTGLTRELTGEAVSLAELAAEKPGVWTDSQLAQAFVDHLSPYRTARIMLLGTDERILASSAASTASSDGASSDGDRPGGRLDTKEAARALAGEIVAKTDYSQRLQFERADVLVPVKAPDQHILGVIRLSYPLETIQSRVRDLRLLILGVLAIGLLLGSGLGLLLAMNLERPLKQVTLAVDGLARGDYRESLSERGPAEMSLLARAINTLTQRLHTLEESRRRLLANLVHELGRPLGALSSATQALLNGADEDPELRRELLRGMEAELRQLRCLTEDLTQLHGQVLGSLELKRRPTALADWLPPLMAPWRESALENGLQWQAEIASNLPVLEIDPDRLGQAVGNLLSNAIKYTPQGGEITVGAATEAQEVCLWVGDTGPGISPEEQKLVFTPFFRGQKAHRFPQGMGLGLSIARDVVTAHNGRLDVVSTPGHGSRFTIRLPATGGLEVPV